MKQIKFLLIPLIVLLINACDNSNQPEGENNNLVYSTSFESESDISGWSGLTKDNLVYAACPDGKNYSLHVGGGCIQPAASYEIPAVEPGKYKIYFWGKMGQDSQSAGLSLKQVGNSSLMDSVNVQVTGTDWKYYESAKSMLVSSSAKLKLDVLVGGIIFADVYIDNLKIVKID